MKAEDVNMNSLGIESLDKPDFLVNGGNIKVKAKAYKYNEVQEIFFLKPILVEAR